MLDDYRPLHVLVVTKRLPHATRYGTTDEENAAKLEDVLERLRLISNGIGTRVPLAYGQRELLLAVAGDRKAVALTERVVDDALKRMRDYLKIVTTPDNEVKEMARRYVRPTISPGFGQEFDAWRGEVTDRIKTLRERLAKQREEK